jgi:hypothetical protein
VVTAVGCSPNSGGGGRRRLQQLVMSYSRGRKTGSRHGENPSGGGGVGSKSSGYVVMLRWSWESLAQRCHVHMGSWAR